MPKLLPHEKRQGISRKTLKDDDQIIMNEFGRVVCQNQTRELQSVYPAGSIVRFYVAAGDRHVNYYTDLMSQPAASSMHQYEDTVRKKQRLGVSIEPQALCMVLSIYQCMNIDGRNMVVNIKILYGEQKGWLQMPLNIFNKTVDLVSK